MPEELKQARLYPQLPPEGKPAFCFYPMSKRRAPGQNWFTLPYDERKELMYGHGKTGRTFAGRVLQVVTGSTGVDDWEWGVTLFAVHPDDLKEVVYTMRFDEASAIYAEFGTFVTGMVGAGRGGPRRGRRQVEVTNARTARFHSRALEVRRVAGPVEDDELGVGEEPRRRPWPPAGTAGPRRRTAAACGRTSPARRRGRTASCAASRSTSASGGLSPKAESCS